MIQLGNIHSAVVQWVGNKTNGDGVVFSSGISTLAGVEGSIMKLIEDSFHFERLFHFTSIDSIELNYMYRFTSSIFEDDSDIVEQSHNIARHLYEQSIHPNTKGGELYVIYYKNCLFNETVCHAIAILKTESKDIYLKSQNTSDGISIKEERGTSLKKLDKGCIVFNIEKENGYVVASVDNTNNGNDAHYWTDQFLHLEQRCDSYHQTEAFFQMFKTFIKGLAKDQDISNADKAILARRCADYLQSEESFSIDEISEKILQDREVRSKFNDYSDLFQKRNDLDLSGKISVSNESVQRNRGGSISIVKLDNHFEIKFLGGENYVVRGYDEKRCMYYYQLFFNEEK